MAAALEARIGALEAALEQQRERRAVEERLLAYSRCIDSGDEAGWVDCFTADGVFEMRSPLPGYPVRRVAGPDELSEFIAAHTGPPEVHHKHIYAMPEITVEGSAASARGYVVHLVEAEDGRPELQAFGRYLDTLRRCEDGRWRIAERVVEVESSTGRQR